MTSTEKISVLFISDGDASESRTVQFELDEDRIESLGESEIRDIAKREAVDQNIISPYSSLKYWEISEVGIGDEVTEESYDGDNDSNDKTVDDDDGYGYYGGGVWC